MLVLPNCPQPQGHVRRNISSMSAFHRQTDNMRCRLELYYVEQHCGIVVRDGGCLLLSRNMRIFMTKTSILDFFPPEQQLLELCTRLVILFIKARF